MWSLVGQQPEVPSAGQNRRVPVFGGLDGVTGRMTISITAHKRTGDFINFLLLLMRRYPGRHLFLFLDNVSIHKSKAAFRFLADHKDQFTPIWNAPYTPELNHIERYWGHLKARAMHNYFFGTVDLLKTAIQEAVVDLNRSKVLRMPPYIDLLNSYREAA
jgi:transposase